MLILNTNMQSIIVLKVIQSYLQYQNKNQISKIIITFNALTAYKALDKRFFVAFVIAIQPKISLVYTKNGQTTKNNLTLYKKFQNKIFAVLFLTYALFTRLKYRLDQLFFNNFIILVINQLEQANGDSTYCIFIIPRLILNIVSLSPLQKSKPKA